MAGRAGHWEVRFTPYRQLYSRANDPLLLFRELAALGEINVRAILTDMSGPERFRAVWRLLLQEISLFAPDRRKPPSAKS